VEHGHDVHQHVRTAECEYVRLANHLEEEENEGVSLGESIGFMLPYCEYITTWLRIYALT
jgi:hypothetical protein